MSSQYSIIIRPGYASWKINDKIKEINSNFGLDCVSPAPPAITAVGPFEIDQGCDEKKIMAAIETASEEHRSLPYHLDGWNRTKEDKSYKLLFNIVPSEDFRKWHETLISELIPFTNIRPDANTTETGSIPATGKLPAEEMRAIWKELGEKQKWWERLLNILQNSQKTRKTHYIKPIFLPVDALRVTLCRQGKIIGEYDLPSKNRLSAEESKDTDLWQKTLANYRIQKGYEITNSGYSANGEIFVISDLHLGHDGIIDYCSRPFISSECCEMDTVLIDNWNQIIQPDSRVFFLGDLSYNKKGALLRNYLNQLNGRITFIRGNHDPHIHRAIDQAYLQYDGHTFLFIHNPRKAPDDYKGWIIHGHTHNSDLRKHPFIDAEKKRINVSVETIGYCPVPLSYICSCIKIKKSGQILCMPKEIYENGV